MPTGTANDVTGNTLAATKWRTSLVVNRTAQVDGALYQLQTQLIPQYNKIFLSNGRNPNDPRLVELAQKIGGTPVEIWEDREYWGETNAMVFSAIALPKNANAARSSAALDPELTFTQKPTNGDSSRSPSQ